MEVNQADFPACYINSDIASGRGQNYYKRITYGILFLLFISTVYNSISGILQIDSELPNKINAFILLITAVGSTYMVFFKPEKDWYVGRAVSESVKTLSWRFMMRSEPFNTDTEQESINTFTDRLKDIIIEANKEGFSAKDVSPHSDVITPKMTEVRNLTYLERKDFYSKYRINDQVEWYGKESIRNGNLAVTYGIVLITFQVVAAIYLYFFSQFLEVFKLNEVMIYVATATISILEMNKHKDLRQSYALTKSELTFISTRFGSIQDKNELNQFVLEAEQAISREHTMWLARRGASAYLKDIHANQKAD